MPTAYALPLQICRQGCCGPDTAPESIGPYGPTGGSAPSSLTLPPLQTFPHFQEVFKAYLVRPLK